MEIAVTSLKGVGPALAENLARLGIHSVQDVLFCLPLRYQDRTHIHPVGSLRPGAETVIEVEVRHAEVVFRRRRMLLVMAGDGSGQLLLRFFHFNSTQQQRLKPGVRLRCFGSVRMGNGLMEMVHPEYRLLESRDTGALEDTLTPIYPATEGVQQRTLRRLSAAALEYLPQIEDWLPNEVLRQVQLPDLREALETVHRPGPQESLRALLDFTHPAQRRLAFEELLAQQLSLQKLRAGSHQHPADPLPGNGRLRREFLKSLPFDLTTAQQRVVLEIEKDITGTLPMMRLVQGDVGSGKTIVAALACLQAIESGKQAALMAPTEILAEQHRQNLEKWLLPLGVEMAWLSGRQKTTERKTQLASIASGQAQIIIGTHALFQDEVEFAGLGLVVIDEQHRFGVHQRLALRKKGEADNVRPHQLIMTATPIPRTLAQTAYADLDVSVIDELPPGRKKIKTVAMPNERRSEVVARVAEACKAGQQCYWVCTLVEESDVLQSEAAENSYAQLQQALPQLRIGLVHGRMKAAEKDNVMQAFKVGEIQLLVATTVIEVGVDVANASLMIIENAERLGLSQLHQLRGRVGRGSRQSACVLLYQPPLSDNARLRLQALRESQDGFRIAEIDLELRGPGELLGTRQAGIMQFRIADLLRDQALIPQAKAGAQLILSKYPERVEPLLLRWFGEHTEYQKI